MLGSLSVTTGTLVVGDALTGSGAISIGAGALLDLAGFNAGGGTDALPTMISGAGTLELSTASSFAGGTLAVATLIVRASLAASGTIGGAVIVIGTLEADAGLLSLTGGVAGSGTLLADAGAVLDIAGGGTLAGLVSGPGTLQLDSGSYSLDGADGAGASVATIAVDSCSTLSGKGTLAGWLFDAVTLAASGGTLLVGGVVIPAALSFDLRPSAGPDGSNGTGYGRVAGRRGRGAGFDGGRHAVQRHQRGQHAGTRRCLYAWHQAAHYQRAQHRCRSR